MQFLMTSAAWTLPYLLLATGGYAFTLGVWAWITGSKTVGGTRRELLEMVRGFRIAVIGLAVTGVGVWLLTDQTWVLVVSLAVGGEELLESSVIIAAIRADPRRAGEAT